MTTTSSQAHAHHTSRQSLAEAMAERPVILDGGLATTIESMGVELSGASWTVSALQNSPDVVKDVHSAFFSAGADVATTASYQVDFDGATAVGLDGDGVERLLLTSVRIAKDAALLAESIDGSQRWVAASVGSYGAGLADGSEYTGDYDLTVDSLRNWHRRKLHVLADSGADVLAIETIPNLREVEALIAELDGLGIPAWFSVTVDQGALRHGESIKDAFTMIASSPSVIAFGVNCCLPSQVAPSLAVASSVDPDLPFVAYPNGTGTWDAVAHEWRGTAMKSALSDAPRWVELGARLVGGCCRITPDQIREASQAVRNESGHDTRESGRRAR